MRIAVIGAGFSGLGLAFHLLENPHCQVTLFDPKGVGGGASGVAAGLMHPYVGEQAHRSLYADEAMRATGELLQKVETHLGYPVARYDGITRIFQHDEQKKALMQHSIDQGDVVCDTEKCWIRSGVTVDCPRYLEGLWQLIQARGGQLIQAAIKDLKEIDDFDAIVIAAGAGIVQFPECAHLKIKRIKGQVLTAVAPQIFLERSTIGKGYIGLGTEGVTLGSTYEKFYTDEEPCFETARQYLIPKIASFYPEVKDLKLIDCKAGVRVMRADHYFPVAEQLNPKTWVMTALGSRGLLYHALLARNLARQITMPPKRVFIRVL